ncbi:MAG: mRNA-capping enzyme subunit alpha, guanylyltransferase [Amphiamblys sp. WSBS2006]|nr:MAG: mRNA-capping enzyme subunit alpha, guanylyltransferase [Amphiamblys sp. WSBS2006]
MALRVSAEVKEKLQQRLGRLLGTEPNVFPGSQAVSFMEKDLASLVEKDYFVCEKSDGLRSLLYLSCFENKPRGYFIDREYNVEAYDAEHAAKGGQHHTDTLLDTELVEWDGRVCLVFDIILLNGVFVGGLPLGKRIKLFTENVLEPCKDKFPFQLEAKLFQFSYHSRYILDEIVPSLKHANDGLVFTPVNSRYKSGTCRELLKWKPPEMNTVDFKISVEWKERVPEYALNIAVGKIHRKFAMLEKTEELSALDSDPPDGKIAECSLVDGQWRFLRFREDKTYANDESVVRRIMKSISEDITRERLLSVMAGVREKWKAREDETRRRALKRGPEGDA